MTCVGYGKIILLGEHAVVYGYPALAAALDRGVTMAPVPTPAGGPLRLDIRAWNLSITAQDDHPAAGGGAARARARDPRRPPMTLVGDAQIPHGAGLGSSAALAVAVTRALLTYRKLPHGAATLTHAANASETLVHGTPSGVDVALAIAGGTGVFRRSTGLVRLAKVPPLRVLVGSSGSPRSTAAMVERVAETTQSRSDDARLRELGALTDTGTAALLAGDLAGLGGAMNRAHALLAELGVATPQLDALCGAACAAGALGAKLTGAGGGGAVIAIAPRDRETAVLAAWKQGGVDGFVATLR